MKRFLLVLAWLLAVAVPLHAQTNTGRIVFEATVHDFGAVAEGEQVRHAFAFRNEGDVALTVEDVRPSCGCTTPTWTTEPVPPGGTGEIVAVFDSADRPGAFRKGIRVFTDGEPTQAVLYIEGTVQPAVIRGARQGTFVFDRTEAPVPDTAGVVFRIQNTGERPVRIRGVEAPEAFVVAWPEAPIFNGDVVAIRVARAPEASGPAAGATHIIRLLTDDAAQPEKTLTLR